MNAILAELHARQPVLAKAGWVALAITFACLVLAIVQIGPNPVARTARLDNLR